MKKLILGIIIGVLFAAPVTVFAGREWSDWWNIGEVRVDDHGNTHNFYGEQIRRFYDEENNLVCWIVKANNATSAGESVGIDCEPAR